MKAPISWLQDFVDIDVSTKKYADLMTLSGSKTEGIEVMYEEVTKVVVGKITKIENHPDANKLVVCQVDVGDESLQIVTGAKNVNEGDYVPVALNGSTLPGGVKIKKGKLRGVLSNGMLCSLAELELTLNDYPNAIEDGIFILDKEYKLGQDIKEALGLFDEVVEFEITSNRPDCFSIRGLALESAVTLEKEFKDNEIVLKEEADEASKYIKVEIHDKDLCPKYTARVCKDIKIEPSPEWMRKKLKASGVRPINNIVDITNYVMLEYGQPMHAFDLDFLEGKEIHIKRANDNEEFITLDDEKRILNSNNLVIADGEKTVALAGVMGGANSEINKNTTTIVFESANFEASSVRLTAKQAGLRTESSARFEKGLDVNNVVLAVDRACQLVEMIGAGKVCKGIVKDGIDRVESKKVEFDVDRINAFLGTKLSREFMAETFKRLQFEVFDDYVLVPTFRPDVESFYDVAEEIARFYDYNNIEPTLLVGKQTTVGKRTRLQSIRRSIRNILISQGFYEIYTFSFTSPKNYKKLGMEEEEAVLINNPLGEDYSIMRTTTYAGMLGCLSVNYNRRTQEALLFELSKVYKPKGKEILPEEIERITLGAYGDVDYFDLKGAVEVLFDELGIEDYSFDVNKSDPSMHPGRTATVLIGDAQVGVIGQVHPKVTKSFSTPRETYMGYLDLIPLLDNSKLIKEYKVMPKYPSVNRDLSIVLSKDVLAKDIERVIKENAGRYLEEVELFDIYESESLGENMRSLAYSMIFRATDRTLNDEDINKPIDKIIKKLKEELNASLR